MSPENKTPIETYTIYRLFQYANRKQSPMLLFVSMRVSVRKRRAVPASLPNYIPATHTPITLTLLLDDFNHFKLQKYNMHHAGSFPFTPKLSMGVMFQHSL